MRIHTGLLPRLRAHHHMSPVVSCPGGTPRILSSLCYMGWGGRCRVSEISIGPPPFWYPSLVWFNLVFIHSFRVVSYGSATRAARDGISSTSTVSPTRGSLGQTDKRPAQPHSNAQNSPTLAAKRKINAQMARNKRPVLCNEHARHSMLKRKCAWCQTMNREGGIVRAAPCDATQDGTYPASQPSLHFRLLPVVLLCQVSVGFPGRGRRRDAC